MDDLTKIFHTRKTIIEMLKDRGYQISDNLISDNIEQFRKDNLVRETDLFIDGEKKCYIKFLLLTRVRPNMVRECITQIYDKYLKSDELLLLIIKNKPNSTLLKISKEFKGVQIFWQRSLIINITKHQLNPKFIKIDKLEIDKLLHTLQISSKLQLPVMLKSDPISLYYDYMVGDVIKVIKKSGTAGEYISYRCIK